MDVFDRQRRLAEVGDVGQARLAAATVVVPLGPPGELACRYLERAGIGEVHTEAVAPLSFPHAEHFRYVATREVATGAWLALHHIRAVVLG